MALKNTNTFETIEGIAKGVVQDAKQSITGNYPDENKTLPDQQKTQIKADDARKTQAIRQNIALMNQQQKQIRQQQKQQQVQQVQNQNRDKQEKKIEVRKKESVLTKILRSRAGTKEGVQRVGN